MNDHTPPEGGAQEPGSSDDNSAGGACPLGDRMIATLVVPGRRVHWDDYVGSTPIWGALEGRTFPSGPALAAFVGEYYGFRSSKPIGGGSDVDGLGWWITDTMNILYRNFLKNDPNGSSYDTLVPSMTCISTCDHATFIAVAHEAAGLVTLPVEALR